MEGEAADAARFATHLLRCGSVREYEAMVETIELLQAFEHIERTDEATPRNCSSRTNLLQQSAGLSSAKGSVHSQVGEDSNP